MADEIPTDEQARRAVVEMLKRVNAPVEAASRQQSGEADVVVQVVPVSDAKGERALATELFTRGIEVYEAARREAQETGTVFGLPAGLNFVVPWQEESGFLAAAAFREGREGYLTELTRWLDQHCSPHTLMAQRLRDLAESPEILAFLPWREVLQDGGKGVSMLDGALWFHQDEAEEAALPTARQTVDRWQKSRTPKPKTIGVDERHRQIKLYRVSELVEYVYQAEPGKVHKNELSKFLSRKARPARKVQPKRNRPQTARTADKMKKSS